MAKFRTLAFEFDHANGTLHHTRKGPATPGDPDQIRGASSIVAAARVAMTLTVMSEEEAQKLGIDPTLRRDYFRLDGAKKNYSRMEDAEWFERIEYELDNTDRVAMPFPYTPTEAVAATTDELMPIVHMIGQGSEYGPWSPRLSSEGRSVRQLFERRGIGKPQDQKAMLNQLLASNMVQICDYYGKRKAKTETVKGLRTSDGEPRSASWVD
jgi:hypothetical protein